MLGEKIKLLRKQKNISQDDFAKMMGYSRSLIANWERDLRDPDTAALVKMADFFNVSVDYLLSREDYYGNPYRKEENAVPAAPASSLEENFIREYRNLFSEKSFRAYTQLYRMMDETQKIFVIGMIVGYLRDKGVDVKISY